MSITPHQYPVVHTVTVLPASQTRFYFIPITDLQPSTTFRDIWTHLKRLVKRLEHITIYPDAEQGFVQGWIMVHKFVNFAKVLEALRKPVYVEATSQSSIITPSAQNAYDSVSIQLPMEPSSHVAKIIADAAGCAPWCICFHEATNRETTCGSQMHLETCRDTITWNQKPQLSKRQASKTRSEIVIAHGTYHPETKQISPGPVVPRSSKSSRKTRKPRQPTFKAPPTPPKTPPIHLWKKFETYYEPPSYMPPSPPAVFEYQLFYPPCYDHPFPYHNYGQDYAYDPAYCYYLGYPNQAPQFYGMAEQVYSLEAPKYPTHSHRRARGTWNQRSNPVQGRIARGLYW